MKRKALLSFLLLFVLIGMAGTAFGLTVLQLNVQQLTELADRVFVGKCISVKSEADSAGRAVQYVTYQVEDMIKGPASDRITFKQLQAAGDATQHQEGNLTVTGVFRELPTYQVGEESVVFLSNEGSLGLTAPIGLLQGKFVVHSDAAGLKTVANGMGNAGLFINMDHSAKVKAMTLTNSDKTLLKQNGGDVGYDDFLSLVKRLATQ